MNLHIRPGERIALVGPNGAGKTTLIKLLTRLYDPTEGQILLDGVDLREYDLTSLRQRIGVIFQDFVQYHLTARRTSALARWRRWRTGRGWWLRRERGRPPLIERLPEGYETWLGRRWEKGHELSGGEWQKVALSRAFMRDAEVLVLDEPTAAWTPRPSARSPPLRELTSDRWPCSSATASPPCAWPTASSSSRAGASRRGGDARRAAGAWRRLRATVHLASRGISLTATLSGGSMWRSLNRCLCFSVAAPVEIGGGCQPGSLR